MCIQDRRLRRSLARLRTSSHALGIETGRHMRISDQDESSRMCTTCNALDDETHFLLHCSRFSEERRKLFSNSFLDNPVFNELNDEHKVMYLLNLYEKHHQLELAKLVHNAFTVHSDIVQI